MHTSCLESDVAEEMEYGYREQCFYIFWEQKKGAE
jgi:hypothetical protein